MELKGHYTEHGAASRESYDGRWEHRHNGRAWGAGHDAKLRLFF